MWPRRRAISCGVVVRRVWKRTLGVVSVAAAVFAAAAPPTASATGRFDASDATRAAEYQRALSLGVDAYVYGYPLLDTDRVFRTATSANVPNGSGGGPVNEFSHIRRFTNPSDKAVVASNRDTLYSMAWLDLSRQPVVLHMPMVKRRFVVFELLDPYTNAFAQIGSVGLPPGDYADIPPDWHGHLPRGVRTISSPYTRVWIIGRTYVKGVADIPNVVKVQDGYAITPLSVYGWRYTPPRPRHVVLTTKRFTVPGTGSGANPLAFYDALGDALTRFPPPAADGPLLKRLRSVGIGAGLHPSTNRTLDAATRQGLHDAVAAGATHVKADIRTAFVSGAPHHNGLARLANRNVRNQLHDARDRRRDRARRAPVVARHLPVHAHRPRPASPVRGEQVRGPLLRAEPSVPGEGLLVADAVRLERLLRAQPRRHLSRQ
jgi:hypothetical protein